MKKLRSTLRMKVLIALVVFSIGLLLVIAFFSRQVILASFLELENKEAVKSVERTKVVFDQQLFNLDTKLADWAIWDDTYQFVQDKNKDYIDSNLKNESLHNLGVNAMFFIDSKGALLYEKQIDFSTLESQKTSDTLRRIILQTKPITTHSGLSGKNSGVIKDGSKLVFYASRPILQSDGKGPIAGTLVFIRFYDKQISEYLRRVNSNNLVEIIDYDSKKLSSDLTIAKKNLNGGDKYYASTLSEDKIAGYTLIYDVNNKPIYLLENIGQREIYNRGFTAIVNYVFIIVAVFIVSIIFVLFLINKYVLSKITILSDGLDKIISSNNQTQRLKVEGNDEFTNLSLSINQMLDEKVKAEGDLVKFKLAIENSSDHIVITDKEGRILFANKGAEQMTGYAKEEMIGNTPRLWGGTMPKEFYATMWETIKDKKQPFKGKLVNKRKDGNEYSVELGINPILDDNGDILFFVGNERNIDAEKLVESSFKDLKAKTKDLEDSKKALANVLEDARELEEQLKLEKESVEKKVIQRTAELNEEKIKLSASISSLTVGFIMTDKLNNILVINQAARNIFCNSNTSPLATVKNCTLTHIEDELKGAIDLRGLIARSVTKGQILLVRELPFQNRFLKIILTPIIEDNQAIGCVVLVEDITEAKITERSRDEFFSIASHELRTPLTAIKGNSSMIEQFYGDRIKDPELKDMIGDIHESSERLIQIVNDFLDTSRLEQGRMEFKKVPIAIPQLIQDVIKEYQVTGSRKMLSIEYHPDTKITLPQVFADIGKTKQVLINLIGNGLKFTEKGGITITTQIIGDFVKVFVSDTGRGISKANQALLFHKFQQANTSILTRDTTKGTGLGLYISKLIVEGMGGEIKIEDSVEGKGTTFSFTLPIATKEQQTISTPDQASSKIDIATGLRKAK
ncbi:MAG: PAS domain S-box protein [Candidatus Levybacteria bacterium]|nr:PAS domain S-box protein [Candidatus Levybacteria bacterium]